MGEDSHVINFDHFVQRPFFSVYHSYVDENRRENKNPLPPLMLIQNIDIHYRHNRTFGLEHCSVDLSLYSARCN